MSPEMTRFETRYSLDLVKLCLDEGNGNVA